MNAIQEIITIMSESDKQAFAAYLKQQNKGREGQNLKLFKSFETDITKQEKIVKPFGKSEAAYHALRKRLYDALVEFMANRAFETDTSDNHEVLRLLVVSTVFFEHKLYKEAFKCLAKAESKAAAMENFSLLNEIYHTHIQFAHFGVAENLDEILGKFTANREKMQQEEQMNIAYAVLRRELGEIYHKGKVIDFTAFIRQLLEKQGVSPDALTYKSLYQILFIANEYASINNNFSLVEPFMEQSYSFISGREEQAEKHLYYHINILYLLANMHFRNFRYSESEAVLQKMAQQLEKQNRRYYDRFAMRYFMLLALNKQYLGIPSVAINTAEKALKSHTNADPADLNDLRLCLIVFQLQLTDRTAFKHMREFSRTESWYEKRMGMDWAIKKRLVEILLHVDFKNIELALSLVKSFRKRYRKYLESVKEQRVMDFLKTVEHYINYPESANTEAFAEGVEQLIESAQEEGADIFVISFLGWLEAKSIGKNIYDTPRLSGSIFA